MRINKIYDLHIPDFIEAWDRGLDVVEHTSIEKIRESENGNLNIGGTPFSISAPVVMKNHPLFFHFVEQGVRSLVKKIVIDLNHITFSSCQGHPVYHSDKGSTVLRPRNVSILPREATESQKILQALGYVCHETNASQQSTYITTEVNTARLEVCNHGYTKYWPSIDINFSPLVDDATLYFEELEEIYQTFLEKLSDLIYKCKH